MPTKAGAKRETMAELAASLLALEGEKIEVVPGTNEGKKGVISQRDLNRLLDRSPRAFATLSHEKPRGKEAKAEESDMGAFEVYHAPVDEGNDALARMLAEDSEPE